MILILPLDGTEASRAAIPIARTLTQIEGTTLHILHVAASATTPGELLEELGITPEETRGAVVARDRFRPPARYFATRGKLGGRP